MRTAIRAGRRAALAVLICLGAAVGGCVNIGKGTPARQPTFVLEPTAPATGLDANGIALGVGPVTIPGYLSRNQMVSREAQNRLHIDHLNNWGAPLGEEVQRVLGENVGRLLRSERVATWPWSRHAEIAVRVPVQVQQFEPVAGRGVVLVAGRVGDGEGEQHAGHGGVDSRLEHEKPHQRAAQQVWPQRHHPELAIEREQGGPGGHRREQVPK